MIYIINSASGLVKNESRLALRTFPIFFLILLSILSLLPRQGFSQLGAKRFGEIINRNGIQVDMFIEKPKTLCANKSWVLKLNVISQPSFYKEGQYLSWKFKTVDCDDYLIENCFSVDMSKLNAGINGNDWSVDAKSMEQGIYDVRISNFPNNDKTRRLSKAEQLIDPTSVSGNRTVNSEQQLALRVEGGKLPVGGRWVWYLDNCGTGQAVFAGEVYRFKPGRSRTLFVRGETQNKQTQCLRVDVLVNDESVKPSSIQVVDNLTQFCEGSLKPRKLRVEGGELGLRSEWVWYEGVISDATRIASGSDNIEVRPGKSTRYFVRAEGRGGITLSVSYDVEVMPRPPKPSKIIVTPDAAFYCAEQKISLTVESADGATAQSWVWKWNVTVSGRTKIIYGKTIDDSPESVTRYEVSAENACGTSEVLAYVHSVMRPTVLPFSTEVTRTRVKKTPYTLVTNNGGILGDKANWLWYSDPNLENYIGAGKQIKVKSIKERTIYLTSNGSCNPTSPRPISIQATPKNRFGFINVGLVGTELSYNPDRLYDFYGAVGFGKIYVKSVFSGPSSSNPMADKLKSPDFETNDQRLLNYPANSGSYYEFTNDYYPRLRTYTIGYYGGGKIFNVYFGAGYGTYDLMWGLRRVSYSTGQELGRSSARNVAQSLRGPSIEGGLILKLGFLNLMSGVNMIYSTKVSASYINGHLGVGIAF